MSSAISIRLLALIASLFFTSYGPALAQTSQADDDDTRAVKLLEAPSSAPPSGPNLAPPPPAALPPPPALPPSAVAPVVPEAGNPPNSSDTGTRLPERPAPSPLQRPRTALGPIPIDSKVANTAEVAVELLPSLDVTLGTRMSFRVTSKKPGYLILLDVDADGKLTQIFPVPNELIGARAQRAASNHVVPGKPLYIPTSGDVAAGLEYVAAPPSGVAMVVAILSDKPVQIIDLPDVPAALTGQAEALAFLTKLAKELRIPVGGRLQEAHWSFDAKFYAIR